MILRVFLPGLFKIFWPTMKCVNIQLKIQVHMYLEDRLRLAFEVFSHRGDNEDAAEESPGLLEILTPIKLKNKIRQIDIKIPFKSFCNLCLWSLQEHLIDTICIRIH